MDLATRATKHHLITDLFIILPFGGEPIHSGRKLVSLGLDMFKGRKVKLHIKLEKT